MTTPPPPPAAEAAPIGAPAMNAAAIATAANPSTVERNGRCEVIVFSIQFFVETGVSRRANYEPQI